VTPSSSSEEESTLNKPSRSYNGSRRANAKHASTINSNPVTRKKKMSMSLKPKRNGSTEPQATSTQAEAGEVSTENSARDEEIRRRAYEIYLERGEQPGRELDDWLQAERELERGVLWRAQAG
jgi:hypothetical protein